MPTPLMGRADRMNAMRPGTEVLGQIPAESSILKDGPAKSGAQWTGPSGNIDMEEGPPPWELEDVEFADSDARRFVTVPDNWKLYWINQRLLESAGPRHWSPVTQGDPRVTVKVAQMISADGSIRRGGEKGDILSWMYISWYDSLRRRQSQVTQQLTQAAMDNVSQIQEDFKRQKYGPYVSLDSALHPTHTMAEIKDPTD